MKKAKWIIIGIILSIVIPLVVGILIKSFFFTFVKVEGPSMRPTLEDGDRLFIVRFGYKPEPGDIIVFRPDYNKSLPYIKRVIAVGGQNVDIDFEKSEVYIDGVLLNEPYLLEPDFIQGDVSFPVTVPNGHVFVMGDNRNNSEDSRRGRVGMVRNESIMGKAVSCWWPLSRKGTVE